MIVKRLSNRFTHGKGDVYYVKEGTAFVGRGNKQDI